MPEKREEFKKLKAKSKQSTRANKHRLVFKNQISFIHKNIMDREIKTWARKLAMEDLIWMGNDVK